MKRNHLYAVTAGVFVLLAMPAFLYAREFSQAIATADGLAAQGIITPQSNATEYDLSRDIPLKEIATIATNIKKTQGGDIGILLNSADEEGMDWPTVIVNQAEQLTLIMDDPTKTPETPVSRAEAYAIVMRSVCMAVLDETLMNHTNWTRAVYDEAFESGLTGVSWSDFNPDGTVLRQEVFFLVSDALNWSAQAGGCLPALPRDGNSASQEPGTFMLRFITVSDDIYSHIILSSSTIANVKQDFLHALGISQERASAIIVRDENGIDLFTDDALLRGTLVYIYYTRILEDSISRESYSTLDDIAFDQQPGTFIKRFETTSENIYSYIVKSGGNAAAVRVRSLQAFSLPKYMTPTIDVRDEKGQAIEASVRLKPGQLVYVYIQK